MLPRVSGAMITAWLAFEAVHSLDLDFLVHMALIGLIACPLIAVIFSVPEIEDRFLSIGLATALSMATVHGVHAWIQNVSQLGQEIPAPVAFFWIFVIVLFFAGIGTALGGLIIGWLNRIATARDSPDSSQT